MDLKELVKQIMIKKGYTSKPRIRKKPILKRPVNIKEKIKRKRYYLKNKSKILRKQKERYLREKSIRKFKKNLEKRKAL